MAGKMLNEQLFEQLRRTPHLMRKIVKGERGGHHGPGAPGPLPGDPRGPGRMGPGGMPGGPMASGFPGCGPMGPGPNGGDPGPGKGRGHGHGPALSRERLLVAIDRHEDGVRQKQLVQEFKLNASTVSEFITKLEDDGYVKRQVDPTDKRATLITLTELGQARAAEISDERNEKLEKLFGNLTDAEKEQLLALLKKIGPGEKDKKEE